MLDRKMSCVTCTTHCKKDSAEGKQLKLQMAEKLCVDENDDFLGLFPIKEDKKRLFQAM